MGSRPIRPTFLWLWPATDHEPRCRHVPINKLWRWTESTPRSGWWRSHMAGIYSDCCTREIITSRIFSEVKGGDTLVIWAFVRDQSSDLWLRSLPWNVATSPPHTQHSVYRDSEWIDARLCTWLLYHIGCLGVVGRRHGNACRWNPTASCRY